MKKEKMPKFRNVPIGGLFVFYPSRPESQYQGTYRKVSARKFSDGQKAVKCAASATVQKVEHEEN